VENAPEKVISIIKNVTAAFKYYEYMHLKPNQTIKIHKTKVGRDFGSISYYILP